MKNNDFSQKQINDGYGLSLRYPTSIRIVKALSRTVVGSNPPPHPRRRTDVGIKTETDKLKNAGEKILLTPDLGRIRK